jgi:transcriptional regulator with XRE-family HTH domain
VQAG